MPSRFEKVVSAGLQRIRGIYDKTATFVHGDDEIELERVVIGKRSFRFVDQNGFTVHTDTRDFLVETEQMGGVEPRTGNLIRQTIRGWVHTYKVVSLNNEPCFMFSDDNENTMRIHTQFVSKVPE